MQRESGDPRVKERINRKGRRWKGGWGERVSECVSKHEQAGASGCRGGDASCQQI